MPVRDGLISIPYVSVVSRLEGRTLARQPVTTTSAVSALDVVAIKCTPLLFSAGGVFTHLPGKAAGACGSLLLTLVLEEFGMHRKNSPTKPLQQIDWLQRTLLTKTNRQVEWHHLRCKKCYTPTTLFVYSAGQGKTRTTELEQFDYYSTHLKSLISFH